ncbi:50S ribosomal protein L17 [Marinilongibacter aquaticus]|uniref:50S ribosomal protein L17 n=1 Tax=Marinilongibacter aquaticus TaxID=2975157 RepID=UPI0021BD8EE6|nr:50S ribosomal protein L17 [Marinilongibacter aquaticus]UBM59741.1 50S ribosomal protein L17 [Marinilongibacter aquaticus]
MRHGKKVNHLGRTKAHRDAMLSNMASSLFKSKRIKTTLAKAKSLRMFAEPLITKAKKDTTHSRRVVFSYLQDKEAVKELFDVVAEKVAERNGGYTRIIKLGTRLGDNAEMALIELVDFNELLLADSESEESTGGRRRRRRGGKKSEADETVETVAAETEEAPTAEETNEESADSSEEEKEA